MQGIYLASKPALNSSKYYGSITIILSMRLRYMNPPVIF